MTPKYSILMIGYKSLDNVKKRINEAYTDGNPTEFILIINYYSEESWRILEYVKNEPRVTRFIFCSQNIGYAKAMNLAYNISLTENLIICSDDCSTNSHTHRSLINALQDPKIGISCLLYGTRTEDIINLPQGFILGIKKEAIQKSGNYIYDEIASPLGCEVELAYRIKVSGFDSIKISDGWFSHHHDISNNPKDIINYLGIKMSPQGENAFQFETEEKLKQKIESHKKKIKN